MKVILVNPGFLRGGMGHFFKLPPLGLMYIAGGLKTIGIMDVKILDLPVHTYSNSELKKEFIGADVVGISCLTSSLVGSKEICQLVKEVSPSIITILGGIQPSMVPELARLPNIDGIIRGEGEITIQEVFQKMKNGEQWQQTNGVSYFNKETGKLIHMPDRPLMETLDQSPIPRYEIIEQSKYRGFGLHVSVLETSRGCNYGCNFCCITKLYKQSWRAKSTDRVVEELKQISSNIQYIFLVDDNYVMNKQRAIDLSKAIIKSGIKKNFLIQARADILARNPDLVDWLARSGVKLVFIGIESIHPKSLKAMNKGIKDVQLVKTAIENLHQKGIAVWASLITGAEETFIEGRQALETTLDFLQALNVEILQCTPITAYPGTDYYTQCVKKGWIEPFNIDDPASIDLSPDRLEFPRKGVKRLSSHAMGYFFLNFRYIKPSKWLNFLKPRWFWLYRILFKFIRFILIDFFIGYFIKKGIEYQEQDFSRLKKKQDQYKNPKQKKTEWLLKKKKQIMDRINNFQLNIMHEIELRKKILSSTKITPISSKHVDD